MDDVPGGSYAGQLERARLPRHITKHEARSRIDAVVGRLTNDPMLGERLAVHDRIVEREMAVPSTEHHLIYYLKSAHVLVRYGFVHTDFLDRHRNLERVTANLAAALGIFEEELARATDDQVVARGEDLARQRKVIEESISARSGECTPVQARELRILALREDLQRIEMHRRLA